MVCGGPHVRAVGWLAKGKPFPKGPAPEEFVEVLQGFVALGFECTKALRWPIIMGVHTCELCRRFDAHGEIGVPDGDQLWVAPRMILHYVMTHSYLPPQEFLTALQRCSPPGSVGYAKLAERFRADRQPDPDSWSEI